MFITNDDVLRVAERARLRVTASEAAEGTADLTVIVEYVDSIASALVFEGQAPSSRLRVCFVN